MYNGLFIKLTDTRVTYNINTTAQILQQRYSCPCICNLPKHEKWILSLILGSKLKILYIINDIEK